MFRFERLCILLVFFHYNQSITITTPENSHVEARKAKNKRIISRSALMFVFGRYLHNYKFAILKFYLDVITDIKGESAILHYVLGNTHNYAAASCVNPALSFKHFQSLLMLSSLHEAGDGIFCRRSKILRAYHSLDGGVQDFLLIHKIHTHCLTQYVFEQLLQLYTCGACSLCSLHSMLDVWHYLSLCFFLAIFF